MSYELLVGQTQANVMQVYTGTSKVDLGSSLAMCDHKCTVSAVMDRINCIKLHKQVSVHKTCFDLHIIDASLETTGGKALRVSSVHTFYST